MRTTNSIKNTIATLLSCLSNAILGIISLTVFIKLLDVEYIGINGLFSNVLFMLGITELGIGNAIIVNLYKPLHENNTEKIKSLLKFYQKAYNIIALTMFLIGILIIPFLGYFIKDTNVPINLNLVYLLHLITVVSSYLVAYKRSILYADQKDYILKYIEIGYLLITTISQIIILYLTRNYYLYLIMKIICQIIQNIVISLIANRRYPYLKDKNFSKIDKKTEKDIFGKVGALSIHKVSGFIVNGTDNIIISTFLGLTAVGLYSNYNIIINNIKKIFYQMIEAVTASIGNLLAAEQKDKTYEVYKKIKLINTWLAVFSSVSLLVIMQDFICLWIGQKYLLDNFVLIILVFNYYQKLIQKNYKVFKDAAGIWKEDKLIPILESILNIVFSILLLKKFGLAGVFMGTIISSFVYWLYSYPKLIYKKLFKRSYLKYTLELIEYLALFIITAYVTTKISSLFIISNIFLKVIIDAICCCIIPNLLLLLIFFHTTEFKYFISLIRNIVLKRRLNQC